MKLLAPLVMGCLLVFPSGARASTYAPARFVYTKDAIEFEGWLERGKTYRALVALDKDLGWWPVVRLKIPYHHAARIEWLNQKDYRELRLAQRRGLRRLIIFEVADIEIYKVAGQRRWNTIYRCRIKEVMNRES